MTDSGPLPAVVDLLTWASAIGLLFLSGLAYLSRTFERNPSSVALLFGGTFWLWCQVSSVSLGNPELRQVFFSCQYLALAVIPPFLLGTSFRFTGRPEGVRRRATLGASIGSVLFIALVMTDPLTHWFFVSVQWNPGARQFDKVGGAGYYAFLVFLFAALAVSLVEFGHRRGLTATDRKRTLIILVALGIPFLAGLADVFHLIRVPGLSLAPVSCFFSALLVAFGIGRARLLNPHQPEAHEIVVEQLSDPVIVLGSAETVDWANRAALNLFAGTDRITRTKLERFSPAIQALLPRLRRGETADLEAGQRFYRVRAQAILNHESGPKALVLLFQDVSQSRTKETLEGEILQLQETQGELVRLIQEKEVLFQEVHHRVKNNLQTVISLINLQARRLPADSPMKTLLDDMKSRVRTISLVHEQIYRTGFASGLDLRDYLSELVGGIEALYGVQDCTVTVAPTESPIIVDMDFSLDFGLVINELVTNAFKHGILVNGSGQIEVKVDQQDRALVLSVHDTGPGFAPRGAGERASTLGLSVVRAIIKKYKAELTIEQNGGTTVMVTVPREDL